MSQQYSREAQIKWELAQYPEEIRAQLARCKQPDEVKVQLARALLREARANAAHAPGPTGHAGFIGTQMLHISTHGGREGGVPGPGGFYQR